MRFLRVSSPLQTMSPGLRSGKRAEDMGTWGIANLSARPVVPKDCAHKNPAENLLFLEYRFLGSLQIFRSLMGPRNLCG